MRRAGCRVANAAEEVIKGKIESKQIELHQLFIPTGQSDAYI